MTSINAQIPALTGPRELGDEAMPEPTMLLFKYNTDDPLEILVQQVGESETRSIARDLLMQGRFVNSGEGEIQVSPFDLMGISNTTTMIDFVPEDKIMLVPTPSLSTFLARTQQLVPLGEEKCDIDSAITKMLAGLE